MTDSDTTKTETIWDAIFNRTIKSKNLVPFCIIFTITTSGFINWEWLNKRFIINTLKEPEFAWFSFYISITLTSIGITRLCDKLGIFKAISLCPFLSDFVYWCILDYREMKDNLQFNLNKYHKLEYANVKRSKTLLIDILEVIVNEELSVNLRKGSKEKEAPHYSVRYNENLDVEKEYAMSLILLKHLCSPKHRSNTIAEINARINNHINVNRKYIQNLVGDRWEFIVKPKKITEDIRNVISDIQNVISDMITKSIKWGILEEYKDGTISMPRGMVRYFDIIEYGFFYEGKYPILKCISVPYYFITNNSRLVLYAISIIIL